MSRRLTSDLQTKLQETVGPAYHIERELTGAGMSRVFVATESELERQVVIKVLPPDLTAGMNIERFRRAGTEVAVIEVGLGGRFDATNVIGPLACAITSIAFDHERHLGTTLAAIVGREPGPNPEVVAKANAFYLIANLLVASPDTLRLHADWMHRTALAAVDAMEELGETRFPDAAGLDGELARQPFVAGDRLTIADITACPGTDTCKLGISSSRIEAMSGSFLANHPRVLKILPQPCRPPCVSASSYCSPWRC
mgnify:CR=1 FL=1